MRDDAPHTPRNPKRKSGTDDVGTQRDEISKFVCELCNISFVDAKALGCHCRAKHGQRSDFVQFVGDITRCPVCLTEYHSRVRLLNHLGDRRIRSKTRGVSCHDMFLSANPAPVSNEILTELLGKDRASRRDARNLGRTHELVTRSAERNAPSVLKRSPNEAQVRRRIRGKRPDPNGNLIAKNRRVG